MENEKQYIVIELQKNAEGQVSNLVTSHDSLAKAENKYYTILASASISDVPVHSAIIVSEEGVPVKYQCYNH